MSVFKQQKNKRFSYTPQHLKEEELQINQNLQYKGRKTNNQSKQRGKSASSMLIWILILGIIIVLWFILDNYKN